MCIRDRHTNDFKYTEISPPLIVNEEVFGTGQLPKFEEDQFEIKFDISDQRKFLIPTAEVVLTNLVRKSVIEKNFLPKSINFITSESSIFLLHSLFFFPALAVNGACGSEDG